MRVGYPVEKDDKGQSFPRGADVLEFAPVQGPHLDRRALVDRAFIDRHVKPARLHHLGHHARGGDSLFELVERVLGQNQTQLLAPGIGQGIAHRMKAEKPQGLARLGLLAALFLYHPGRLLSARCHWRPP